MFWFYPQDIKNEYNNNVAKKNKNIIKIRKKLDKLDDKLLIIFKKRTLLVNKILSSKTYKNQIIDRKRIKVILKRIKKKSQKNKLDHKITHKIWKSIIGAYIDYEFRNFKKK